MFGIFLQWGRMSDSICSVWGWSLEVTRPSRSLGRPHSLALEPVFAWLSSTCWVSPLCSTMFFFADQATAFSVFIFFGPTLAVFYLEYFLAKVWLLLIRFYNYMLIFITFLSSGVTSLHLLGWIVWKWNKEKYILRNKSTFKWKD